MEFPHELKELYPNQIIEVRGNADALTIILNRDVDIYQFKAELIKKFSGLEEQQTLFIKHEDKQDFEKLILE
jgi:phage regulator Rha-like protein